MAHTKFTLSVDRVMTGEEQLAVISDLEPVALKHGLQRALDVRKPKFTLTILADHDPENPRVFDDVSVMWCAEHRSYTLGDDGAEDPFVEVEGVEYDGQWLTIDEYDAAIEGLELAAADWFDVAEEGDGEALATFGTWHGEAIRRVLEELGESEWEERSVLRDDIALIKPLYLYDHSGITISHGAFSCTWDSGQVGWHYVTKEAVDNEWCGDLERAEKFMDAVLETYDQYLRGDVYGFQVKDEDGDIVESVWGFYGADPRENGMAEHFPDGITDEMINEAMENIQYG